MVGVNNVVNTVAYLRTSREFPEEMHPLTVELNKSYVDTANAINVRIIGIFPANRAAVTGESWYFTNQKQQSFRQIYPIIVVGGTPQPIPHGLILTQIERFTRNFGQFTDGTNWYGLNSASNVAIAGQITFYVGTTNITFLVGAGAPAITKGSVVLEWLSNI
jgi:hypothetical protein